MRVIVDEDICAGCGLCEETCPGVFKVNTIAKVKVDLVPAEAEAGCRAAVKACPVEAISIQA